MSGAGEERGRCVRVRISGRVQGVGFRAWTQRRAMAIGLSGWVQNRPDGSVDALFCGSADAVEAMLAACREGPRGARVTEVSTAEDGEGEAGSFEIR
jgi:acylphosphatase